MSFQFTKNIFDYTSNVLNEVIQKKYKNLFNLSFPSVVGYDEQEFNKKYNLVENDLFFPFTYVNQARKVKLVGGNLKVKYMSQFNKIFNKDLVKLEFPLFTYNSEDKHDTPLIYLQYSNNKFEYDSISEIKSLEDELGEKQSKNEFGQVDDENNRIYFSKNGKCWFVYYRPGCVNDVTEIFYFTDGNIFIPLYEYFTTLNDITQYYSGIPENKYELKQQPYNIGNKVIEGDNKYVFALKIPDFFKKYLSDDSLYFLEFRSYYISENNNNGGGGGGF